MYFEVRKVEIGIQRDLPIPINIISVFEHIMFLLVLNCNAIKTILKPTGSFNVYSSNSTHMQIGVEDCYIVCAFNTNFKSKGLKILQLITVISCESNQFSKSSY